MLMSRITTAAGCGKEKKNRRARITPNAEGRFHAHHHRGPDAQRRDDQSNRDAIGDFLKAYDKRRIVVFFKERRFTNRRVFWFGGL